MMKKDRRKSEYFGTSKGLKFMLLIMMTAMSLFCLSACITIQVPEKKSNKDVQTEAPKSKEAQNQTENPNTADAQTGEPNAGDTQNNSTASSDSQNKSSSSGSSQSKSSSSNSSQNKSNSSSDTKKKAKSPSEPQKKETSPAETQPEPDTSSNDPGGPAISQEQAINIALSRVKGATKNDIISFKLDYDDGRWEYEGKIKKDGVVYEFEIDGQNGNILEWEIDD